MLSEQSDIKPKWVDLRGKLVLDVIKAEDGNVEIADLSRKFQSQVDYEKYVKNLESTSKLSVSFHVSLELYSKDNSDKEIVNYFRVHQVLPVDLV